MADFLRKAKDNSRQRLFKTAYVCNSMSSLDYLRKRSDYICQRKFHPAVKLILHLQNHFGNREPVVSNKLIDQAQAFHLLTPSITVIQERLVMLILVLFAYQLICPPPNWSEGACIM